MNVALVILLWLFFGLQHSYLARPSFKKKIKKYFGFIFEKYFYRFFYFLSQCIIFYFIYEVIKMIEPGKVFFKISEDYIWIIFLLNKLSNIFLIITVFHFDISKFIGLTDIFNFYFKKKYNDALHTHFLYKYIRHPMYLGIILTYAFSTSVYTTIYFINLFCIILYIEIGLYYEEITLTKHFKNKYIQYKKKTFRYLPFLR